MKRTFLPALLALLGGSLASQAAPPDAPKLITSFETADDMGYQVLQGRNTATLAPVTNKGVTDGKQALQVTFGTSDWPQAYWSQPAAGPWDWHAAPTLAMDITNPGKDPVTFHFRVDDDRPVYSPHVLHTLDGSATIAPGASGTYYLDLVSAPATPPAGRETMHALTGVNGELNPAHVIAFQIYVHKPATPQVLIIDNVRLLPGLKAPASQVSASAGPAAPEVAAAPSPFRPAFHTSETLRPIASFEAPADIAAVTVRDGAAVAASAKGATEGKRALQITFPSAPYPNASWSPGTGKFWDWRGLTTLVLDVTNPGTEPVTFNVRVDDGKPVFVPRVLHTHTGAATLAAGASGTFFMDLASADEPKDYGMRAGPPATGRAGMTELAGVGEIDPSHVIGFQIFVHQPDAPQTLLVDNIRLLPSPPATDRYAGIVDAFGQYTRSDWPGKVHTVQDLTARRASEAKTLAAAPALPGRDEFGGWAAGPQLPATGHFGTVKRGGKWWLVDPAGHLFLSWGIVSVSTQHQQTMVTGREKMFTFLPAAPDPLAKHLVPSGPVFAGPVRSGQAFDFYGANLERKYGPEYQTAWQDVSAARLRAWGFNTASWDGGRMFKGKIPYAEVSGVPGAHARVKMGGWGPMDDPYDPQFAADAATRFRAQLTPIKDDPWCLGIMVGNEMSWGGGLSDKDHYSLVLSALSADASKQPAKRAFLSQLQAQYGTVDKLNAAWGTSFAAWDALGSPPLSASGSFTPAADADLSALTFAYAQQWFRTVHDALQKAAPHQLFLGCRFAAYTPEAARAASEYADVLSFNIYQPRVDPKKWAFLSALNKPVIVTEYHFGALDRGMFAPGMVSASSQTARAAMYKDYLHSIVDNPVFVGAHWFEYVDEPLTGRAFDGENYEIGLVSVTDTPYPEFVAAARAAHAEAYARRAAAK